MSKTEIKSYLKIVIIFSFINLFIYLTTLLLIIAINIFNGIHPLNIPNGFLLNIPFFN